MLQSGVPEIIHIVQLPLYLPVFPVQIGCEDVLADQIAVKNKCKRQQSVYVFLSNQLLLILDPLWYW